MIYLWLLKHWRGALLALIAAGILGWWALHKAADNRMELRAITAEYQLAALQASLADAHNAAKVAIAAKVEAEREAAKRLREREAYWRRVYGSDPQAKAWSEQEVPAAVLEGLK